MPSDGPLATLLFGGTRRAAIHVARCYRKMRVRVLGPALRVRLLTSLVSLIYKYRK